jgi:hypothetical protein
MPPDDLYNLDIELSACIGAHEDTLDAYWANQLNSEDWSEINQLRHDAREIAELFRKRAMSLQNIGDPSALNAIYQVKGVELRAAEDGFNELAAQLRKKIPLSEAQKVIDSIKPRFMEPPDPEDDTDRPLHLVWQHLCILDARDAVDGLSERVHRIFQLEDLVEELHRDSELPDATMQFLALVGRTFVWGFHAECVVVCRGAIDTAFRGKVPTSLLERRRRREPKRDFGLLDRIEAAYPDLISESIKRDANCVRLRGDKAIHFDPQATDDILDTVRRALRVIDRLAVLPPPSGQDKSGA